MSPFNFQAMLQTLAGVPVTGNVPQGNPLDPNIGAQQAPQQQPNPQDIVVNAKTAPAPVPEAAPAPPNMGNADFLREAAQAQANAPGRKGMFGTRGTLRDVLGTLGDAFLIQSGNKAIYAPQRQQEKLADAMTGFTQDPLAALERMSHAGFGGQAEDLYKDYVTSQNTKALRDREAATAADANYQKYGNLFSQYMGSASPETYARIKPLLQQLKTRGGLGDEYSIPDEYDQGLAHTYQYGGMPATQQVRTGQVGERIEETKRHNRANEDLRQQAINKPPAGRNPPQPTDASMAAPIINKMQQHGYDSLSNQEKQVLQATGADPTRRGVRKGSALERLMGGGNNSAPTTGSHPGFTVTRQ